jgi:hypothetical protein
MCVAISAPAGERFPRARVYVARYAHEEGDDGFCQTDLPSSVASLDVRRLAALDMWGASGTRRRRRIIRAEFVLGAVGCACLGLFVIVTGSGWMIALGIWLICAGINYVPLALHAHSLSKPGALDEELRDVDLRPALRRASVQQFWIAVPLALVVFDVRQQRSS